MFKWDDYVPIAPEDILWDAVVVGAGMGGAFLGLSLAQQNLRVLFLERGTATNPFSQSPSSGYWRGKIAVRRNNRSVEFCPPMGDGPGGSSAIYGAALERFKPEDFDAADHSGLQPTPLPGAWPI